MWDDNCVLILLEDGIFLKKLEIDLEEKSSYDLDDRILLSKSMFVMCKNYSVF